MISEYVSDDMFEQSDGAEQREADIAVEFYEGTQPTSTARRW